MRTLHHYDSLGLLVPARRTFSGHRLYSDLARTARRAVRRAGDQGGQDEWPRLFAAMQAQTAVWRETPREGMVAQLERHGDGDAESRIPTPELNEFCERAHAAAAGC